MRRIWVCVLAIAVASSGCSVLWVQKPHVTADKKVECTSEMTLPLVDAAVGVVGIATPFVLEAMRDRKVDNPNFALYTSLWVPGAIAAVSSIIGFTRVRRCRRMQESMARSDAAVSPPPAP